MSFTRFHDDEARILKQLQQSVDIGRYQLNTPGNGTNVPFIEDPHIRLQYWGANLMKNTTDLESELRCITRKLNHYDNIHYKKNKEQNTNNYPSISEIVDESRATHPAWIYRDLEQTRCWEENSSNNVHHIQELPFSNNMNTRILQKDDFVRNLSF